MPPPHLPLRSAAAIFLLLLLDPTAAFSLGLGQAAAATAPSPRLALLRDLKTAAADHSSTIPLSTRIRTAILDGGHRPLTRTEIELIMPRDRAGLRALEKGKGEEEGGQPPPRSTDKEAKQHLGLGLSLRAYEAAIAENHGDIEVTLERWRRVVALRQNRVLVPGRAAELYGQLISTLLWAGEEDLVRQVLQYVGLTPEGVYLPSAASSSSPAPSPLVCDLNGVCRTIAKIMLDIPLERWEWEVEGRRRGAPEPPSPKEQGEAIAEWHWKQVAPAGGDAELEHYVNDMCLSVLRLALREAKRRGRAALTLRLQEVSDPGAPFWGVGTRGLLLPRAALELLRETDAPAVGVDLELQEP